MFSTAVQQKLALAFAAASLLIAAQVRADDNPPGNGAFVYVMTNQSTGNTVVAFQRAANGGLNQVQEVSTQGLGTGGSGDPLGSQGALRLSNDGQVLVAVNAGSNDVSSLAVTASGLQFVSKVASGGVMPVSVALSGDIAYVLNAGGTPNVTAFNIGAGGALAMIPNSTVALPGGPGCAPAQVGVSPDGEVLVVTEKATNRIDLFPIGDEGQLLAPATAPSNGTTPFGFSFGRGQALIVSEAANSTISSYRIVDSAESPTLQTITASLPDSGAAACWLITDRSGRLAFVANAGSSSISSLSVAPDGSLALSAAVAAATGSGTSPIDMALARNGQFLYVLSTSNGTVIGFRVQNGALSQVTSVSGLPLSIQGIAAR